MNADMFEPAYSTLIIATKSRSRFWDGDAVRTEHTTPNAGPYRGRMTSAVPGGDSRPVEAGVRGELNPAGAPLLDWWRVPEDDTFVPRKETEMGSARYIVGDVFDVLATLEPGSVDLVMTSPPFLALRSYLPADHESKHLEIGSEATPGEFIDRMLDVVEACARVLAPHGSLVFELGDTYAGSGGAGGDYSEGGLRDGAPGFDGSKRRAAGGDGMASVVSGACDSGGDCTPATSRVGQGLAANGGRTSRAADEEAGITRRRSRPGPEGRDAVVGWPLDKSKVLIPQLFAIALAYGFNPLTGRQTEPWRVRNTVAWCRPNPPVGRDGDKFRPATSFLTVACKARDRYWDGDAVRTALAEGTHAEDRDPDSKAQMVGGKLGGRRDGGRGLTHKEGTAGAPLLDWWEIEDDDVFIPEHWVIPTHGYPGAHYATYPPALVVPIVKSMCPAKVCRVCGEPSRRITAAAAGYAEHLGESWADRDGGRTKAAGTERNNHSGQPVGGHITSANYDTLGWSDCGHADFRNGMVLDPFGGSGVTGLVATGHGRDCILIDLDERNAELARERIGPMFLEVEHFAGPVFVKRSAS